MKFFLKVIGSWKFHLRCRVEKQLRRQKVFRRKNFSVYLFQNHRPAFSQKIERVKVPERIALFAATCDGFRRMMSAKIVIMNSTWISFFIFSKEESNVRPMCLYRNNIWEMFLLFLLICRECTVMLATAMFTNGYQFKRGNREGKGIVMQKTERSSRISAALFQFAACGPLLYFVSQRLWIFHAALKAERRDLFPLLLFLVLKFKHFCMFTSQTISLIVSTREPLVTLSYVFIKHDVHHRTTFYVIYYVEILTL